MEHQPYIRPRDRFWYLRHPVYKKYMLREATSIFIGLWTLNVLFGVLRLSQGEGAWNQWLEWQSSKFMLAFSLLSLLMAMIHTVTWFAVAPKAMPRYIYGRKIDPKLVITAHWLLFSLVSMGLIIFTVWGS